jgi:putative tryptophan/tyrosine transport system substrate-binding protein
MTSIGISSILDLVRKRESSGPQAREPMTRRDFIMLFGGAAAAWPFAARAQQPEKIPRIGVLWHAGSAEAEGSNFRSLVKGLSDLDYVEGRSIKLEHRFPNEMPDRFKSMAAELASSNVDVLIGVGNDASTYAKDATTTIPVVFFLVADPVGSKLVDSLAQPGGNVTGLSNSSPELFEKRLALLKEIIPGLARVAVLANASDQISRLYIDATQAAAAGLGLTGQTFEWHTVNDLGPAFDAMKRAGMQVLTTSPDGSAFTHRALIAQIALARSLPLAVWSRDVLKAGALMSYAADHDAICQHAAVYVDKILKGAKPGELPVEQPTKFELRINPKTAKALGLTIPEAFLKRADQLVD